METKPRFKSTIPVQVRFSDVDMMGHVSNTQYQNYYDFGKVDYFDKVLPDMDYKALGVVGASIKIDYLKPIYMKTRLLVETRVSVLGHKSITMEHCLVEEHTKELLSTCTAVLVCYCVAEKKSIPIPQHWRENILAYDEGVIQK
jgi:acyl-CoA thioester hydrolase